MQKKSSIIIVKIIVTLTFLVMVIVNALANILPINGQNTGQVSDSYPNLFAPAGITFVIWGVIYLLLALYCFYQIFYYENKEKLVKVGIIFSISCVANSVWIFSWHYNIIPLSMCLTLVMLVCLILITRTMKNETFIVRVPFSVYFGWLTVATIANATVLLVYWDWNRFGISAEVWTIIIIIVGMLIGGITMLKYKDIAYGLVLIWAYIGILIKHLSVNGFDGLYFPVIVTVSVCIFLFIVCEIIIASSLLKLRKKS